MCRAFVEGNDGASWGVGALRLLSSSCASSVRVRGSTQEDAEEENGEEVKNGEDMVHHHVCTKQVLRKCEGMMMILWEKKRGIWKA